MFQVLLLALVATVFAAPEAKAEPKPEPKPQFSRVSVTSGQTPYAYSVAHVPASYYASYPGAPFAYSGYYGGYPGAAGASPYYSPYSFAPYGGYPYSPFRYY